MHQLLNSYVYLFIRLAAKFKFCATNFQRINHHITLFTIRLCFKAILFVGHAKGIWLLTNYRLKYDIKIRTHILIYANFLYVHVNHSRSMINTWEAHGKEMGSNYTRFCWLKRKVQIIRTLFIPVRKHKSTKYVFISVVSIIDTVYA